MFSVVFSAKNIGVDTKGSILKSFMFPVIILDTLPTNVFSGPRINIDEKILTVSVFKDHPEIKRDFKALYPNFHILRNITLDCWLYTKLKSPF